VRRSAEQWHELVARFEQSGQSREQFCAERGLALSSFCRWQGKLREEATTAQAAGGEAIFVQLAADAASSLPAWEVELQLGAGVLLRLRRPC
jgi:hypothetical protein